MRPRGSSVSEKDPVLPPPKAEKNLVLTAGKCVLGGDCLAVHGGKTFFIEDAIPGEEVEVRLLQEKKDIVRARVARVLKPSASRVEPVCPHVGICGGCQYQHMSYDEELRWKESQVRETLERVLGAAPPVRPILHGHKSYGYRRGAAFHVVRKGRGKPPAFAFIGRDNVTPVLLEQCDLLEAALQNLILRPPARVDAKKVSYKLAEDGQTVSDLKESIFRVTLSGTTLLAHSQSFFQNNREVTEMIAEKARLWVTQAAPGVFFDLYAGIGTFSFLSARGVPRVFAIEESRQAVSALRMNREESGWKALEIFEGRVERVFPGVWERNGDADSVILLDPPRQGMEKRLREYLAGGVRAKRLLYISCDPATLARDLKTLIDPGAWRLSEVVPFDMFPRTKHVEAAALLVYNGS